MELSEIDIQNSVMELLIYQGINAWRNPNTTVFDKTKGTFRRRSRYERSGVPDILGILPDGKFLGIEVKKNESEKLSPDQKKFFAEASENAVLLHVWSTKQVRERLSYYFTR